ncbi:MULTISPECIES: hypothetical protein [Prosthecochloris]|uniref:hypothetical protein n=1 Tax=Prosthecochloris TaxID=1101 RepID=UPI0033900973
MYDIAVDDLGIQPSEFWQMCPQEFWRLYDKRIEKNRMLENPGRLTEKERESLLETLDNYKKKHGCSK